MAESEEAVFKPRPKHLLPIVLGLVATGILAYPISNSGAPPAQVTPFAGTSITGASLNALIFVLALGASATAMFLLIRRGRIGFIRRMIKGALILVSFAVVFWYSASLLSIDISLLFTLSIGVAALIGFTVFGKGRIRQLFGVTALSALTGVFLGYSIPLFTALGPVGALAKTLGSGDLPGAMYSYGDLTIGMGDLVFYSLVATTAMVTFGVVSFLGAAVGILAGTYLGFRALSKYEMFPGLPFSLLLGVAGMLLPVWL